MIDFSAGRGCINDTRPNSDWGEATYGGNKYNDEQKGEVSGVEGWLLLRKRKRKEEK